MRQTRYRIKRKIEEGGTALVLVVLIIISIRIQSIPSAIVVAVVIIAAAG